MADLIFRFLGDINPLKKATAEAKVAVSGLGSHVQNASSKIGGGFHSMSSAAASFGIPFTGALDNVGKKFDEVKTKGKGFGSVVGELGKVVSVGGIAGLAAIGAESVHLADSFEQAHARLQGAVKNTGGTMKEFAGPIDAVNKKLEGFGFTNTETESSLATLTRAARSTHTALGLMGLAADLARGRHISLEQATAILSKVTTGHVALLGRFGIATKDANGKTISQAEAIKRLTALYGGQAKAILSKVTTGHVALLGRFGIATKDANGKTISQAEAIKRLTALYGGQAKTSTETFAGKMQVLKAQLEDTGVKIGLVLIPIIQKLAIVTANIVDWLEKHKAVMLALAIIVGGVLVAAFIAAASIFVGVGIALAALVVGVVYAWEHFKTFRVVVTDTVDAVKTIFEKFVQFGQKLWQMFGDTILKYVTGTWDNIRKYIDGVLKIIRGIIQVVTALIHGDWGKAWDGIKLILSGAWEAIGAIVRQAILYLKTVLKLAWDAIGGTVHTAWDAIVTFFKGIPGRILTAVSGLGGLLKTWAKSAASGAVTEFSTVWNGIKAVFEAPINWVISNVINRFSSAINRVLDFLHVGTHIPSVGLIGGGGSPAAAFASHARPRATGGMIDTATELALLHKGEGVIPAGAMRKIGRGRFEALRQGRIPSFQLGGIIGDLNPVKLVQSTYHWVATEVRGAVEALARPVINAGMALADATIGQLGAPGQFAAGAVRHLGNAFLDWLGGVDKNVNAAAAVAAPGVGGAVARWAPVISQAFRLMNYAPGPSDVNAVLDIIRFESGGNPNAINLSDINAQHGIPSQGLMQVIPPTFRSFHIGGTSDNILDPLANIAAGVNYALHRYGSLLNVPGVAAVMHGGRYVGYEGGGWVGPSGGFVHPGEFVVSRAMQRNIGKGEGAIYVTINMETPDPSTSWRYIQSALRELEIRTGKRIPGVSVS